MRVWQGIFGHVAIVLGLGTLFACQLDAHGTSDPSVTGEGSTGASTGDPNLSPSTGQPTTTESSASTGMPEPPAAYDEWLVVHLPGAVCGNGSQYKIFVNYHEGAKDLLVMLEPGGACWDFDTCSGKSHLGAAHPDGVPDDLMYDKVTPYLSPLIRREAINALTPDWNFVFIPYCTGDVHTGNNVITYKDPSGVEPDLEFHHNGHNNIMAATQWMATQFPDLDRLFVTGCSAGGAGSLINYHFFRQGLAARRGYLMNDSGPIFPSSGKSGPLHQMIRASWNVDSVLGLLPPGYTIDDDFGVLNTHLSSLYPDDRLSTVFFQRDYNYSRYSYERFYPNPSKDQTLSFWAEDTDLLTALYADHDNLAYYLPYWRGLNDSHCVSIISYLDTAIEEKDIDLEDFVTDLLDDAKPLMSYRESVQPSEDN